MMFTSSFIEAKEGGEKKATKRVETKMYYLMPLFLWQPIVAQHEWTTSKTFSTAVDSWLGCILCVMGMNSFLSYLFWHCCLWTDNFACGNDFTQKVNYEHLWHFRSSLANKWKCTDRRAHCRWIVFMFAVRSPFFCATENLHFQFMFVLNLTNETTSNMLKVISSWVNAVAAGAAVLVLMLMLLLSRFTFLWPFINYDDWSNCVWSAFNKRILNEWLNQMMNIMRESERAKTLHVARQWEIVKSIV